jgi:hypothetical protein
MAMMPATAAPAVPAPAVPASASPAAASFTAAFFRRNDFGFDKVRVDAGAQHRNGGLRRG